MTVCVLHEDLCKISIHFEDVSCDTKHDFMKTILYGAKQTKTQKKPQGTMHMIGIIKTESN